MVRTRADSSVRKAVAAKAPRKQVGSSSGASSSSKTPSKKGGSSFGGGGNPVRVCDIPAWQKGIGEFYPKLNKKTKEKNDKEKASDSEMPDTATVTKEDISEVGSSHKDVESEPCTSKVTKEDMSEAAGSHTEVELQKESVKAGSLSDDVEMEDSCDKPEKQTNGENTNIENESKPPETLGASVEAKDDLVGEIETRENEPGPSGNGTNEEPVPGCSTTGE